MADQLRRMENGKWAIVAGALSTKLSPKLLLLLLLCWWVWHCVYAPNKLFKCNNIIIVIIIISPKMMRLYATVCWVQSTYSDLRTMSPVTCRRMHYWAICGTQRDNCGNDRLLLLTHTHIHTHMRSHSWGWITTMHWLQHHQLGQFKNTIHQNLWLLLSCFSLLVLSIIHSR